MKLKKNNRIKLISLILFVIVLFILAGLVITTLGAKNGLLAKVKKEKEAEIKTEMKDVLALALHDLQIEKKTETTLDDVTQEWINEKITKYECTVKDDASLSGKQVIMKKDKIAGKFLIDESLNIIEEEYNESSIEFEYETREREENRINIAIIVKDEINGIKEIQIPDGTIYTYNKKTKIGIDYSVELGVEYKIKITSESGEIVEKSIKIDDYYYKITKNLGEGIKIDNTAIKTALNKPYQATITTEHVLENITVTMGGKAVTVDKTTGVISIDKVTDNIEITATALNFKFVKYDAGDWTKEEIEELQNKKLYDLNEKHITSNVFKLKDDSGFDFTFGGFTYKGDTTNQNSINSSNIITSRNQSINNSDETKKYEGWQILESNEKDGKEYVSKLIHVGTPENFVFSYTAGYDGYRADYLLSNGKSSTGYNTLADGKTQINKRSWDMYKDKNQLDLIDNIHCMIYEETVSSPHHIMAKGYNYWLDTPTSSGYGYGILRYVDKDGITGYNFAYDQCWGIRPVVTMVDGVYIVSGTGTEADPYVLGKD